MSEPVYRYQLMSERQLRSVMEERDEYKQAHDYWEARAKQAEARVAELEGLMREVLAREHEHATFHGLRGCNCINHSQEAERQYELGICPHQRASAVLAQAPPYCG